MTLRKSIQKYIFGQILSVILAATGLINSWLSERKGINIPAMQAAFTYTLILAGSTAYLLIEHLRNRDRKESISVFSLMQKFKGILVGSVLFDVAANLLVVKAFSELKLPEVMVFSGLSTPTAICLALIWSKPPRPKYTRLQITGVLIALSSILFYFYVSQRDTLTKSFVGITCAVLSAIAYAASNNFQEQVAQVMRPVEFLFGLGLIGSMAAWLIVVFSSQEFSQMTTLADFSVVSLIICYSIILSSFYFLIPVYMSKHSAVSFNFSLLTANFLGIIGSWFLLQASYSNWLYISIILINVGLLIYYIGEESSESKIEESKASKDFEGNLKV